MKAVTQTIENESEEQRGVFLGVLSGALGASLSGNMLAAKRATTASQKGLGVNRRWRWRSNSNELKTSFLIAPYPLTSFKIEKYHQNEPQFNGVYSRNHLHNSKLKDGTHVINLDEYKSEGPHWIALYLNCNHLHNSKLILIALELNIFMTRLKKLFAIET